MIVNTFRWGASIESLLKSAARVPRHPGVCMANRPLRFEELTDWETRQVVWREPGADVLSAMARLRDAWDQDLVPVGPMLPLPGTPSALTTWQEPGLSGFAFACSDGIVQVGEIHEQDLRLAGEPLRVADWDECQHEVLCLFRHEPAFRAHKQLYVATRRWPAGGRLPEPRLYRALIHRESAAVAAPSLHCEPSLDGARRGPPGQWMPLDLAPAAVDEWLNVCSLVGVMGADLVARPPKRMLESSETLASGVDLAGGAAGWSLGHGRVVARPVCALWTGTGYLWGCDDDSLVWQPQAEQPGKNLQSVPLGACPRCTAAAPGPAQSFFVIVGCHDQRLRVRRVVDSRLQAALDGIATFDAPVQAVACIPGAEGSWPDVLVALRGGALERLRFVGRERIRGAWASAVQRLRENCGLSSLPAWLEWAAARLTEHAEEEELRGLAALLVSEALREGSPTEAEIQTLADFLQQFAFARIWPWLGHLLGAQVAPPRTNPADQRQGLPQDEAPEWMAPLAKAVYLRTGSDLREALDLACSRIAEASPHRSRAENDATRFLRERASWNLWDIQAEPQLRLGDGERHRLRVLVDFATEAYSLECHRHIGDFARGLAVVGPPENPRLAIIGRHALHEMALAGGRLAEPVRVSQFDQGPVYRHIRTLALVDGSLGAIVGAQNATAFLVDAANGRETIQGPPASSCRASAPLEEKGGEASRFALGWNQGQRSFVEVLEARPRSRAHEVKRLLYLPLATSAAGDMDALATGEPGRFWLGVGDPVQQEVALSELDIGKRQSKDIGHFAFGAGVTAVRFDRVGGDSRLLVGTRDGMLWCLGVPSGEVLWVYRVRRVVRSVDVCQEAAPDAARVAVFADPDHLVLLDADGRRVWRRRVGRVVRSVRFIQSGAGAARLGLACVDGLVALLRRPEPAEPPWCDQCLTVAQALGPPSGDAAGCDQAAWETVCALGLSTGRDVVPGFEKLRLRKARQVACQRAATALLDPEDRERLVKAASLRELLLVASRLPAHNLAGWAGPLLQRLSGVTGPEEGGDNSRRAWYAATAELLRRLDWRTPDVRDLAERLKRLPAEVFTDRWVQLEAARAWVRAARGPSAAPDTDTLLAALHLLPPAVATVLDRVHRPPQRGQLLAELGRLAAQGTPEQDASLATLARPSETLATLAQDSGLVRVLWRLVAFVAAEDAGEDGRWESLRQLLDAARAIRPAAGVTTSPFVRLALALAAGLDEGWPHEAWPLARQIAWVRRQLERSSALGPADEPDISGWERLARTWAQRTDRLRRDTLRQRLARLETTTRPFVHLVEAMRMGRTRVRLDLRVHPEGVRPLDNTTVTVQPAEPAHFQLADDTAGSVIRRKTFVGGEPSERVVVEGFCAPATSTVSLLVRTESTNQPQLVQTWTFPLPPWPDSAPIANLPFPEGLPSVFKRVVAEVAGIRRGVGVVIADEALNPRAVVSAVESQGRARTVPVDPLLDELGPGRRYPDRLTADAFLRVVSGGDPLAEREQSGERSLLDSPADIAQVLAYPADATFERLLHPANAQAWQGIVDWLRKRMQGGERPAVLLCLSSETGARVLRALGPETPSVRAHRLVRVATPEPDTGRTKQEADVQPTASEVAYAARSTHHAAPRERRGTERSANKIGRRFFPEEREAFTWLQSSFRVDPATAAGLVERALGDLRPLARWGQRRLVGASRGEKEPLDRTHWARVDLGRLSPQDALAVLLLSRATTELPVKYLRPGMEAEAEVESVSTAGRRPKQICRAGQRLDARAVVRLRSRRPALQSLRVRGWSAVGTPLWAEAERDLLPLVGDLGRAVERLTAQGVAIRAGKVVCIDPLVVAAVDDALATTGSLDGAFGLLTESRALLHGVAMESLASATAAWCRRLSAAEPNRIVSLLQAIGRLWADQTTDAQRPVADAVLVARGLSGVEPEILRSNEAPAGPFRALVEALETEGRTTVGLDPVPGEARFRWLLTVCGRQAPPDLETLLPRVADLLPADESLPPFTVLLLGPGVEAVANPPRQRGIVLLRERDIRNVLAVATPVSAFWTAVRAQTGLSRLSPFVAQGALEPGSPMFVGRRTILEEVRAHLHQRSFLIVGARRIGKTSLLQRIRSMAEARPDVKVFYADCQGTGREAGLANRAREWLAAPGLAAPSADTPARELFRALVRHVRAAGQTPVFLLNEIDDLLDTDPGFMHALRGLSEEEGARFVMVGYHQAAEGCSDPQSPLYHWTTGFHAEKSFNLAELSADEALELLDRLEEPPLCLAWDSPTERDRGRELLLRQSYRIPWVIQKLCGRLVRQLDEAGRGVLRLDDVRLAAATDLPVLAELDENTRFDILAGRPGERAAHWTGRALLAALAYDRYFRGDAPIEHPHLHVQDPRYYAFTPDEAHDILTIEVANLFGLPQERKPVLDYLARFPFERLLRNLCLTLFLVPAGLREGARAFCFQNQIFPRELHFASQRGRGGVRDRIHGALLNLHQSLPRET